jgi:hypothetical protein
MQESMNQGDTMAGMNLRIPSRCEKYAHLSKLQEWTHSHVEYSRSETLVVVLQDRCLASRDNQSNYNVILSSGQVLALVPH